MLQRRYLSKLLPWQLKFIHSPKGADIKIIKAVTKAFSMFILGHIFNVISAKMYRKQNAHFTHKSGHGFMLYVFGPSCLKYMLTS